MKELVVKEWSEVPKYLKTKTSLNTMGIYNLSSPCAIVKIYNHEYNLYDINACLRLERKKGNKSLVINSLTHQNYLILDMTTTGKSSDDEILELTIIDFDGRIKYENRFLPQKRGNYSYYFKTPKYKWLNEWRKIEEILTDKIVLVPNTIYAKRLINQTCEKYGLEKMKDLRIICSKPQIQHKISFLKFLGKNTEEIQENPHVVCFDFLNILYPNAKIHFMRRKTETYFNKFCEFRKGKGYINAYNEGQKWLQNEYHVNNTFNNFSYETCEEVINMLYPLLKALGILPRRVE